MAGLIELISRAGISGLYGLESLNLSETNVNDGYLHALAKAVRLRHIPRLSVLELRRTGLGDSGLSALAKASTTGGLDELCVLDIAGTHVTDEGVADLLFRAKKGYLNKLWCLVFRHNGVGDAVVRDICEATRLGGLKQLECLDFCATNVTDASMEMIAKTAAKGGFLRLEVVDVSNTQVAREAASALVDLRRKGHLPKLREIRINVGSEPDTAMRGFQLMPIPDVTPIRSTGDGSISQSVNAYLKERFRDSIKEELNGPGGSLGNVRNWCDVVNELVELPPPELDVVLGRLPMDEREEFAKAIAESIARLRGDRSPDLAGETIARLPEDELEVKSDASPCTEMTPDMALAEVALFEVSISEDRERIKRSFQTLLGRVGCIVVNDRVERNLETNVELAKRITRCLNNNGLKVHVEGSDVVGTIRFSTGGSSDNWRFVVHGKKRNEKLSSTTFDNDFRRLIVD